MHWISLPMGRQSALVLSIVLEMLQGRLNWKVSWAVLLNTGIQIEVFRPRGPRGRFSIWFSFRSQDINERKKSAPPLNSKWSSFLGQALFFQEHSGECPLTRRNGKILHNLVVIYSGTDSHLPQNVFPYHLFIWVKKENGKKIKERVDYEGHFQVRTWFKTYKFYMEQTTDFAVFVEMVQHM